MLSTVFVRVVSVKVSIMLSYKKLKVNMTQHSKKCQRLLKSSVSQKSLSQTVLSPGSFLPFVKAKLSFGRHQQPAQVSSPSAEHSLDSGYDSSTDVPMDYTAGSQRVMGRRELRAKHLTAWDSSDSIEVPTGDDMISSSVSPSIGALAGKKSETGLQWCENVAYSSVQKLNTPEEETEADETYISIDAASEDTNLSPILPHRQTQCYVNLRHQESPRQQQTHTLHSQNNGVEKRRHTDHASDITTAKRPKYSLKVQQQFVSEEKKPKSDVILHTRYHTYTVDDIVDNYVNLMQGVSQEQVDLSESKVRVHRTQTMQMKRRPAVSKEGSLRRVKSGGELKPSMSAVYKTSSCFATSIKLLDCDEVF